MPSSCAVINCSSHKYTRNTQETVSFHRFPKDAERRLEWCKASGVECVSVCSNSVLCSKHFTKDMFDRTGQTVRLRDKATPSVFNLPVRKRTKDGSKKEVIPHKKRNSARLLRKRERTCEENNKEMVQSTAPGLGELVLAAELMEECQQEIQKGFLNDHGGLPLPSDPARLCALVRNLAKERHGQEERLLTLHNQLKAKDSELQEKKLQLEWMTQCLKETDQSKVCSLEKKLSKQHVELLKVQEELNQSRKQLKERTETLHYMSALKQVSPSSRVSMFSVKTLCQGSSKWLHFYTGMKSYTRFQALLTFLQDTSGSVLNWDDQEEDERTKKQEKEQGMRKKGKLISADHPQTEREQNQKLQVSKHDVSGASPVSESGWEETAESVQLRIVGICGGDKSSGHALSSEDQLLLVLTRLRLGLLTTDLAFRFQVAEATVSRVWSHWMELLQRKLQQIPVRCSLHYVSIFQPKHTLCLGPRQLTVLECADLLSDSSSRERLQVARRSHPVSDMHISSALPYRFLCPLRACAVASPGGFLAFCSSTRLEELQEWTSSQEDPKPAPPSLPVFVMGGEESEPVTGMPVREVLSIKSLTDKVMKYHYLRLVHPYKSESQLDQAWEVCCYLACLLHQPMGLH